MKLLALFTFISLSALGIQDSSEVLLPNLEVVLVEDDKSISPKFRYTVTAEEGEFRVLKGISMNRQNLDGIQAILVTPLGDTARVIFPEISTDSLAKYKARPLGMYVAPGSQISIELDFLPYWSRLQESTDTYIGPYPGTYQIRFVLGWSERNWENMIAADIFRGWDPKMIKESLFSEWVSFTIGEEVFIIPDADNPPHKLENDHSGDFELFVVEEKGMIREEWLVNSESNSEFLIITHDAPVHTPTKWQKIAPFFGVYPLMIIGHEKWSPIDSISGSFISYSNHMNNREKLQESKGRIVSGEFEGEVNFRFPYKRYPQTFIKGYFKQSKMDGLWVESELVNEKKEEVFHTISEQSYKEGEKNGLCKEYYPLSYGGGLKKEAIYLNNKINGVRKTYNQNGQLAFVESYLPEYVTYSINRDEDSTFSFPFGGGTQIKHGEFLGYFEDGSLRHRITFENNLPVGECEFNYQYGKKMYSTRGSFKDGNYFEGSFIYWERVKIEGYGRHLPYYHKFWILHYHQGSLTEKELIVDTSKDPLLPPKKRKKLFRKRS